MSADKDNLRKRMRSSFYEAEDIAALWRRVEDMPEFLNAYTVLLYWSLPDEVPTQEFIARWSGRKRIALPVVIGNEMGIRLYSPEKMIEGYRGIMEPSSDSVSIAVDEIDFAIVPGVAFDRNCNRLGRGKGYYDRFLPLLRCRTAGVSYDARVLETIPTESWDVPISAVVTPTSLYQ